MAVRRYHKRITDNFHTRIRTIELVVIVFQSNTVLPNFLLLDVIICPNPANPVALRR